MYKAAIIFLRLLIPFALGIVTAYTSTFPFYTLIIILLIAIYVAADFLLQKNIFLLFRFEWLLGLFLSIILFFTGGAYTRVYIEKGKQNDFIINDSNNENSFILLKLIEPLEYKGTYSKAFVRVLASGNANTLKASDGTILLYLPNNKTTPNLNYGDCILTTNTIHPIPGPINPNQFNARSYYATKNIHYSISLKAGDWKFTGINKGNFFLKGIFNIRNKCLTLIDQSIKPGKERGVLASLLVGDRDHLDNDLEQAFANTGVIHILAVSGMRIGLVYFIINFFLSLISMRGKWKVIKVPIIIILVWSFTLLTGSAASAIRAAMMITFVIIGKNTNRQTLTMNLLAASVFPIVLIYGPLILLDAGFQLSFFAIAGITLFYSPIYNLIEPENKMLYEAWRITVMSVAATIGTLPVALYYFHRFPLYFILSNIIAVPLSVLTIYSGILLIILSPIPFINAVINKLTTFLLTCLDEYISRINQLPFSSIHISYFPVQDLILCLLVIAFIYLFFRQGKTLFLQLSLASLLLICLLEVWHNRVQNRQYSFTVFSIPGANAIEFRGNNQSIFISDSLIVKSEKNKKYFEDYWDNNPPSSINYCTLSNPKGGLLTTGNTILQSGNYYQMDSVRFALIDKGLPAHLPLKKLVVKYLIMINSPNVEINEVLKFYSFNKIIFASSNHPKKTQKWISDCTRLKIPFYSVHDSGAFRLVW